MENQDIDLYLIENDAKYAESLKHSLENNFRHKLNIHTFPTGESCIEVIGSAKKKPKVVILDYVINEKWKDAMNGINTMDHIRLLAGEISVIILSNPDETELAIETLQSGASDYIVKDKYAFEHIRHSIEKSLHQRELRKELSKYKRIVFSAAGIILFIMGWVAAAQITAK